VALHPPEYYRHRWPELAVDLLGVKMHPGLENILTAVHDNHNTAIKACHESGKSFSLAVLAHCWMLSGSDRVVITTAPTENLVVNHIWRYYNSIYRDIPYHSVYPRAPGLSSHTVAPEWYALGLTANHENAAHFQGFHARGGVLYIIDEGYGVERMFFDARERIAMDSNSRFVVSGNCPLDSDIGGSEFYKCFSKASFHTITITAFDVENVKQKKIIIPGMLEFATVNRWRKEYGEDSPFWRARVTAEFLTDGSIGLIPLAWYEAAVKRGADFKAAGYRSDKRMLSVDVAAGGGDESIIGKLEGRLVHKMESYPDPDVIKLAFHAEKYMQGDDEFRYDRAVVDANGVGSGTASTMRDDGFNVLAYKGSEGTDDTDSTGNLKFTNIRSFAYWKVHEALDPNNPEAIGLEEDDPKLREDLVGLKYGEARGGKIQVETKENVIKRIGRSPDRGDNLAMAVYASRRGGVVAQIAEAMNQPRRRSDNPLEEIFNR